MKQMIALAGASDGEALKMKVIRRGFELLMVGLLLTCGSGGSEGTTPSGDDSGSGSGSPGGINRRIEGEFFYEEADRALR